MQSNNIAVVKVTRFFEGDQSAGGENREETIMQDLAVSVWQPLRLLCALARICMRS